MMANTLHQPKVTVAVIPREKFSTARRSLESIYENTRQPFDLVYVDGNSPAPLQAYLQKQAKLKHFKLIRSEDYLTPNQARNIAIKQVDTEYIAFIDNDVLVKPGWLEKMIARAESTGAWAIAPLTLEGEAFDTIHHIGGSIIFKDFLAGRRWMVERRPYMHLPLSKLESPLVAEPTEFVEFHCALSRREVFDKTGLLDEQLMSMAEETDFSLAISKAGGTIYTEPAAIVTYIRSQTMAASDLPYFNLRWSDRWCEISVQRIREKHNLDKTAPVLRHYRGFVQSYQKLSIGSTDPKYLRTYPTSKDLTLGEKVRYYGEKAIRMWGAQEQTMS